MTAGIVVLIAAVLALAVLLYMLRSIR